MPAFHNNLVHFKNKSFKGRAPLLSFSDNGSDSSSSEGDDKDNEVGNFGVGEGGWDEMGWEGRGGGGTREERDGRR